MMEESGLFLISSMKDEVKISVNNKFNMKLPPSNEEYCVFEYKIVSDKASQMRNLIRVVCWDLLE